MAALTFDENTLTQLLQQRDYHLAEAAKIDSALDVLRSVSKTAGKAAAMIGRVQQRVTGNPRTKRYGINLGDFIHQHGDLKAKSPVVDMRRLIALAAQQGETVSLNAMSSAWYKVRVEQRTGKATYDLRLERLGKDRKQAHRKQPPVTVSAETLKSRRLAEREKSGDTVTNRVRRVLAAHGKGPITREQIQVQANVAEIVPSHAAQATAKTLETMQRRKEVKQTKAGWVVLKLQPVTAANDNGAHA